MWNFGAGTGWGWYVFQIFIAVLEMGLTLIVVLIGLGWLIELAGRRVPIVTNGANTSRYPHSRTSPPRAAGKA
jgi:hypothetical protein